MSGPSDCLGTPAPIDGYATHQEVLIREAAKVVASAHGCPPTFLETGCGNYSTPLLVAIASTFDGKVISYVQNRKWASCFQFLVGPHYDQVYVDFDRELPHVDVDLAFMDHERLCRQRILRLPQLLEMAPVVVVHDSNKMNLSKFDVVYEDTRLTPATAVITGCARAIS